MNVDSQGKLDAARQLGKDFASAFPGGIPAETKTWDLIKSIKLDEALPTQRAQATRTILFATRKVQKIDGVPLTVLDLKKNFQKISDGATPYTMAFLQGLLGINS